MNARKQEELSQSEKKDKKESIGDKLREALTPDFVKKISGALSGKDKK